MYLSKLKCNHFHIAELHKLLSSFTPTQKKLKKKVFKCTNILGQMIHFCAQMNEKYVTTEVKINCKLMKIGM